MTLMSDDRDEHQAYCRNGGTAMLLVGYSSCSLGMAEGNLRFAQMEVCTAKHSATLVWGYR